MLMVLLSWHSQSIAGVQPGSFDEYRRQMANNPQIKPVD